MDMRLAMLPLFNLLLLVAGSAVYGQSEKPSRQSAHSIDTIVAAWKSRQSTVRSLDFTLSGKEYQRETYVLKGEVPTLANAKSQGAVAIPSITFPIRLRLVIDSKERIRAECDRKSIAGTKAAYVASRLIEVYSVPVRKSFFAEGPVEFPNAHIRALKAGETTLSVGFYPLLLMYRPFSPTLGQLDASKMSLAPGITSVDGRECLLVKHESTSIWVDPNRGYVPVRFDEYRAGVLRYSISIRYAAGEPAEWRPGSWVLSSFYGPDQLKDSQTVEVTEAHINTIIPEETFEIALPPGTWVSNYTNGERYIIRDNDSRRPVAPGEFTGNNYEQLLNSDPPSQLTRRVLLGVGILGGASVVGILLLRAYRRRAKSGGRDRA